MRAWALFFLVMMGSSWVMAQTVVTYKNTDAQEVVKETFSNDMMYGVNRSVITVDWDRTYTVYVHHNSPVKINVPAPIREVVNFSHVVKATTVEKDPFFILSIDMSEGFPKDPKLQVIHVNLENGRSLTLDIHAIKVARNANQSITFLEPVTESSENGNGGQAHAALTEAWSKAMVSEEAMTVPIHESIQLNDSQTRVTLTTMTKTDRTLLCTFRIEGDPLHVSRDNLRLDVQPFTDYGVMKKRGVIFSHAAHHVLWYDTEDGEPHLVTAAFPMDASIRAFFFSLRIGDDCLFSHAGMPVRLLDWQSEWQPLQIM